MTLNISDINTTGFNSGQLRALNWINSGTKKLFIDGKWVDAQSGKTFATENPATEQVLSEVSEAGETDIDKAVAAARQAFESAAWSGISPHQRARYLMQIADAIESHGDELASIESYDTGVPYTASRQRIPHIAETFRYYAGWVSKLYGTTNPSDDSRFIYMLREPMGVCALINAWNVPLGMAATKIAPALACGNTAVFKPAEQAPLSVLRLTELIHESGLPAGVLNVVPGLGPIAGAAMSAHTGIDKIAFTGSTVVGRHVLQSAANNMKKVSLELGGKSPNIIFPDADLDSAIAASVVSFCRNSGQICSSGTRLFVHNEIYDMVVEQVCSVAEQYKVGQPFEADTQLGPLISRRQMDRVLSYVQEGTREGARLRLGGHRVGDVGYFVTPTIFSHVKNEMKIAQEEIFGPVLSIIPFSNESEVILKSNDSIYGLAAAVWTRDASRAQRVSRALKAGRVWINTYGDADPGMSIGGYKQSGIGREYGAESIDAYTQTKSVLMKF
ncbi:aldehyde dehydrogenase family protein [Advenella mimigardefordensis]|uniref:Aldehyde dehydrogenase n=1 Tax=Advenella mimigardefordensis (strain DSM 17166 / LMG 22922 / DPN7) TaxID=1247726 RepID=W0PFP1_ADVMD|nr:aldehyde dehydrogenase family protein [Advenella mimigardefordensis]AHG64110.1 aldehyde dehydrogenase [Advenella mimigardefordensis DPN7]